MPSVYVTAVVGGGGLPGSEAGLSGAGGGVVLKLQISVLPVSWIEGRAR